MSDILKSLLTAYYDDIGQQMAAGQSLSYLNARFIVYPGAINQDWSTPVPFVLIYPNAETLTPDSVGAARSDLRVYQIGLSAFVEYEDEMLGIVGDQYVKGVVDVKEDLDARYARETFGLSLSCLLTNINYNRLSAPQVGNLFQINLLLQHTWVDIR